MERTGPYAQPSLLLNQTAPTFRRLRNEIQVRHDYNQSRWLEV